MRTWFVVLCAASVAVSCSTKAIDDEEVSSALGTFTYASYNINPSWLSAAAGDIQVRNVATTLNPCHTAAIVTVSPKVDIAALKVAYNSDSAFGTSYALYIKSQTKVVDSSGAQKFADEPRLQNVFKQDLNSALASTHVTVQGSWRGLGIGSDGFFQTLPAGTYTMRTDIQLMKATVGVGGTTSETVVGGGFVKGSLAIGDPGTACMAWKNASTSLSGAGNGKVLVNGIATLETPRIDWVSASVFVPSSVFGNFGTYTTGARLDTLRTALWTYKTLYSIPSQTTTARLSVVSQTVNTHFTHLVARQFGAGNYPLYGQRISASFDRNGRLLNIAGRVFGNLETYNPVFNVSQSSARNAVVADLQARGFPTDRTIASLGQFVFPTNSGFDSIWLIGVDESPSQSEGYRYIVSATTGGVLFVENLSSNDVGQLQVLGSDPSLVVDTNNVVLVGTTDPIVSTVAVRVAPAVPSGFSLADVPIGGRFAQVIWEPGGFQPFWSDQNRTGAPVPASAMDAAAAFRARTTYVQTQKLNDFLAGFGIFGDNLNVVIDADIPGLWGKYTEWPFSIDSLKMSNEFLSTSFPSNDNGYYTPAHEYFHLFDASNVALYRGPTAGKDGYYRMPFSLKEGLANVAVEISEPFPVSNYLGGGALLGCWLKLNFSVACFADFTKIFRKPATTVTSRQYGGIVLGNTNVTPWLDCRNPNASNDCMLFRRRGAPRNCNVDADCATNSCDSVTGQCSNQATLFTWPGTINTRESAYKMAPQVVLDAWESASTDVAFTGSLNEGTRMTSLFPSAIVLGYTAIDHNATYFNFESTLRSWVTILALAPVGGGPVSVGAVHAADRAIGAAFERHGLDEDVRDLCATTLYCASPFGY